MYHSLIISGKNTYDEWGLVPTSRPLVNPPSVKTQYYKNPGGNGELDYTTILTGRPLYEMRKGSWEFWVCPENEWANVYTSLLKYIHGKKHQVILEDDPDFFYTGRLSINAWKSDKHNSLVTIDYILSPYKESINENQDWLWDEHFDRPIEIRTIKLLTTNVAHDVKTPGIINSGNNIIVPTINVSFESPNAKYTKIKVIKKRLDMEESHDNIKVYDIVAKCDLIEGYNKFDNLTLDPGMNYFWFEAELDSNSYGIRPHGIIITIIYRVTSL